MGPEEKKSAESEKAELEFKRLRIEVEKLALEVEAMRTSTWWDSMIGRYLPLVTALLAVTGFWVSLIKDHYQSTKNEADRIDEIHRESAKPFWNTQLDLYIKASEAAATIAISKDTEARNAAVNTFWTMYWGPLSCVEDISLVPTEKDKLTVETAMVQFGNRLKCANFDNAEDIQALKTLSLRLAHAVRNQVGPSFNLSSTEIELPPEPDRKP